MAVLRRDDRNSLCGVWERICTLVVAFLATQVSCSSPSGGAGPGSGYGESSSSGPSQADETLCPYWGTPSQGVACSYSGMYTKPSQCIGLGRRYCDRSYLATECPMACKYEICKETEEAVMQLDDYQLEFLWTDLVVANDFDMVFSYGEFTCTAVCWQFPWRAGCHHGHWWEDRRYCSQVDCSHDPDTRYMGCQKAAPFHRPSCTECAILFPQADCGLEEFYPLSQHMSSQDYLTKDISAECESDASSRECKDWLDSLSSAHDAVTSDATVDEISEMHQELGSQALVAAEELSVKDAEISAQLAEGGALGGVTIAGGGQARAASAPPAAVEDTKLSGTGHGAVIADGSQIDLENSIDFLEIQLQIDPMQQHQWLLDVIRSLPEAVATPESAEGILQSGPFSMDKDMESRAAVVVDASGQSFHFAPIKSFGPFIADAAGLIETTVKQAMSVVAETGMHRIQVVSVKSMNDEMLEAGFSPELIIESDLLTVTAIVWANSPDPIGEKMNSWIESNTLSQLLADAGLPSLAGGSLAVNVLSAPVEALRQADAFQGIDQVIEERKAAAQGGPGGGSPSLVGGHEQSDRASSGAADEAAPGSGLSPWAIVLIGLAVGLVVGPGIGWVLFYVRTVKRNRAMKEAERACAVTNPVAHGFSQHWRGTDDI